VELFGKALLNFLFFRK